MEYRRFLLLPIGICMQDFKQEICVLCFALTLYLVSLNKDCLEALFIDGLVPVSVRHVFVENVT